MSVHYYYDPNTAEIGVRGRLDMPLVEAALEVAGEGSADGIETVIARIARRSERDQEGQVTEYIFDDVDEREVVSEGLRALIAAAREDASVSARVREYRLRRLVGRILSAGY